MQIIDKQIILSKTRVDSQNSIESREAAILKRIKKYYSNRLHRDVDDAEAKEIAGNLLHFAQAIYGE